MKHLHNKLKNQSLTAPRFSRANLIIFAIIFASIGGYLIYSSFAAPTVFFIRDGGTSSTCSDWTDACDALPATLQRGATYYIADGAYSGYTFDDAESGTNYINIKKATAGDHGTDTGWNSTYGDGSADFNGAWTFRNGFYDIDGVTGGGPGTSVSQWPGSWTTGLGITQTVGLYGNNIDLSQTTGKTHVNFRHVKFVNQTPANNTGGDASGSDYGQIFDMETGGTSNLSNVMIDHVYIPAFQGTPFAVKGGNDWTIQNSYFEGNGVGNSKVHRELWSGISNDRFIWRWNYIQNQNNSAVWAFVNNGDAAQDTEIYGNIVDYTPGGQSPNALIDGDAGTITNWKLFNNTIVSWNGFAPRITASGASIISRNNILADHNITYGASWAGTMSHTSFYKIFHTVDQTDDTSLWAAMGTNSQIFSSDPFVDYPNRDLRLKQATQAGSSTDSPAGNTVDMFGVTRGADGVLDRGALEFQSGVTPPPPPPDTTPPTVSLSVPANGATVTGASVTVSATASDNVGVSGVQFKLDGANLNSEDTSSPYSITWNSTTAANGSHTLTAIARDAAGNTTVSTSRTVTVSNTSTPKPADIDKNGVVDITDLSYLLSSYGQTTTTCTTNSSFTCDIATTPSSTNGKIDIFDLSLLLSGYGK
jgi:hypothetical protein